MSINYEKCQNTDLLYFCINTFIMSFSYLIPPNPRWESCAKKKREGKDYYKSKKLDISYTMIKKGHVTLLHDYF